MRDRQAASGGPGERPAPEYCTRPDRHLHLHLLTPFARRQELIGRFLDGAEIPEPSLAVAASARACSIDAVHIALAFTVCTNAARLLCGRGRRLVGHGQ